jgi:hypothetical protein
MIDGHLGQQPLKSRSMFGISAALTLILVDDLDTIRGPSQGAGVIDQSVLA